MCAKRSLAAIALFLFSTAVAVPAFAGDAAKESISKTQDNQASIRNAAGTEETGEIEKSGSMQNLKVGDRLRLQDEQEDRPEEETETPDR